MIQGNNNRELINTLNECIMECNHCISACLIEPDVKIMLAKCIKLNFDCAEICGLAVSFLTRDSEHSEQLLNACANICEACATECEKFSRMEHCKRCAEICRKCADACHQMV